MKKYAVIVAGGAGVRMGGDVPKQFMLLHGKPVIAFTIEAFLQAYEDLEVILVLPQQQLETGKQIVAILNDNNRITITAGGTTRFESVKNGLTHVTDPSVVFVHDGVRCMVSKQLITQCYQQALEKGSAIPAVAATDSIRIQINEQHQVTDRKNVRLIQTPQTFLSGIILPAFQQAYSDAFTDEATVVEANGTEVFLIEGAYNNIKITRPLDLHIAEKLLESGLLF